MRESLHIFPRRKTMNTVRHAFAMYGERGYAPRAAYVTTPQNVTVAEISWMTKEDEDGRQASACWLRLESSYFGHAEWAVTMHTDGSSDAEAAALHSCAEHCGVLYAPALGMDGFCAALEAQLGVSRGTLSVHEV